ncbi:MAG: GIY-YIG nuclease family protein, partial [Desulfobacterales bacterium]
TQSDENHLIAFVFMQNTDNWYVYIIRCHDGSLYTGIATDVERRFAEHQSNVGAKYLRGRGPLKLVFKQRIGQRSRALKVEQGIKRLPKKKKEALIKSGAV